MIPLFTSVILVSASGNEAVLEFGLSLVIHLVKLFLVVEGSSFVYQRNYNTNFDLNTNFNFLNPEDLL